MLLYKFVLKPSHSTTVCSLERPISENDPSGTCCSFSIVSFFKKICSPRLFHLSQGERLLTVFPAQKQFSILGPWPEWRAKEFQSGFQDMEQEWVGLKDKGLFKKREKRKKNTPSYSQPGIKGTPWELWILSPGIYFVYQFWMELRDSQ